MHLYIRLTWAIWGWSCSTFFVHLLCGRCAQQILCRNNLWVLCICGSNGLHPPKACASAGKAPCLQTFPIGRAVLTSMRSIISPQQLLPKPLTRSLTHPSTPFLPPRLSTAVCCRCMRSSSGRRSRSWRASWRSRRHTSHAWARCTSRQQQHDTKQLEPHVPSQVLPATQP